MVITKKAGKMMINNKPKELESMEKISYAMADHFKSEIQKHYRQDSGMSLRTYMTLLAGATGAIICDVFNHTGMNKETATNTIKIFCMDLQEAFRYMDTETNKNMN